MLVCFVSSIIVVMLGVMLITQGLTKRALDENLQSSLQVMSNIAANAVVMGLEFDDTNTVAEAVDAFTKQKLFSYVSVKSSNGTEVFYYRKEGFPDLENVKSENLAETKDEFFQTSRVFSGDNEIGSVTIGMHLDKRNHSLSSNTVVVIVLSVALIVIFFFITLFIANMVAKPLRVITNIAQEISLGKIDHNVDIHRGDEIGELAESFKEMIVTQKQKAEVAIEIANGNLDTEVKIASDQDVLGNAMRRMKDSIRWLVDDANVLAEAAVEGKLDVRADNTKHGGEYGKIIKGVNDTLDAMITPIRVASQVLNKMARRDLTARIDGEYRGEHAAIIQALNSSITQLDEGLQRVNDAAAQVANASQQISKGNQSIADGSSRQASSLEEVSSSLQELSAITEQNTSHAKQARELSEHATQSALKGVESMDRLSDSIKKIKSSSDETSKIVKTIDEIAFQTNLLALNAAVEAARAGDAGKGFAVVAEEVRNLAMRSAEAAKNTAQMIEESVQNAENGVDLNNEVLKDLQEINQHVDKVRQMMADITAASEQQAQGIQQVNEAVDHMNQVTQQTAANSEQTAGAAQEMAAQAEDLNTMVRSFKISKQNGKGSSLSKKQEYGRVKSSKVDLNKTKSNENKVTPSKLVSDESANGADSNDVLVNF